MANEFIGSVLGGKGMLAYLVSAFVLTVGLMAVTVLKKVILHRLRVRAERSGRAVDDLLARVAGTVFMLLYLAVVYLSIQNLALPPSAARAIDVTGVILLTIVGIRFGIKMLAHGVENYWMLGKSELPGRQSMLRLLPVIKVIIWVSGVIFLFDNLGFKVSTVIAGLGIGGIAVALAAQAVLGDMFSYFAILFDRPFEPGDFIVEGEYMGTVEHIGIKTTRIRSLGGEEIVLSNSDLTGSRIRNYKRMGRRRVVLRFGLVYGTDIKKMREIPGMVNEIITVQEGAFFDRAHFFSFGDFSLDFEVVYYVLSSDYNNYMDIQQGVNLAIMEKFAGEGVEFAYPTQTLYLDRGGREGTA